jgi:hypothetical protein
VVHPTHLEVHNKEAYPRFTDIYQLIQLDEGIELCIPLVVSANDKEAERWEDSTGSDPDTDGRYHPQNGSLADESCDPSANNPLHLVDITPPPSNGSGINDNKTFLTNTSANVQQVPPTTPAG